jgi:2-polyprenyl-6-hydroxyphenyl methylase/3-demethylubiquinone-9 3-methyltransferase
MELMSQRRRDGSAPPQKVPLPPRYHDIWEAPFRAAVESALRPGIAILDLGSGRNPTVPHDERPPGTTYVGLDLSRNELAAAPPGSYDEEVVADIGTLQEQLVDRFDLVVSWQVLEHVRDLGAAMVRIRAYLRPGGTFVAMFSGSRSAFALINRVLPFHIGAPLVARVMGRSSSNPVFPAYYDRCHASALHELLAGWSRVHISPFFRGAAYFRFSRLLSSAYLTYEDVAARNGWDNLATHYLVIATR